MWPDEPRAQVVGRVGDESVTSLPTRGDTTTPTITRGCGLASWEATGATGRREKEEGGEIERRKGGKGARDERDVDGWIDGYREGKDREINRWIDRWIERKRR